MENYHNEKMVNAIYSKDLASLKEALKDGANPNYIYDETPILWMAFGNNEVNTEMVKELLAHGADANAVTSANLPLIVMVAHGHIEQLRALLDAGADVNASNNYGFTAIHKAVSRGMVDNIKLLIERGANVNAKSSYGWTPLHESVKSNSLDATQVLLDAGADVNALSNNGQTPLMSLYIDKNSSYNQDSGEKEASLLIKYGADKEYSIKEYVNNGEDVSLTEKMDLLLSDYTPDERSEMETYAEESIFFTPDGNSGSTTSSSRPGMRRR